MKKWPGREAAAEAGAGEGEIVEEGEGGEEAGGEGARHVHPSELEHLERCQREERRGGEGACQVCRRGEPQLTQLRQRVGEDAGRLRRGACGVETQRRGGRTGPLRPGAA